MAIEKSEVLALVDTMRAGIDALPEVDLGAQIAALQAQIAALQVQVDAQGAKIAAALAALQA